MEWLYVLLLLAFWALILYLLYIPLPHDIADRNKLLVAEFGLRLVNEYLGDFVELVGGAALRNKMLRLAMAIAYKIPLKVPAYLTVSWTSISGVPVRVYVPKKRKASGALIFIHGGGWSTMRAEYYDSLLFLLVKLCGVPIFSVDYRLAPEHPFPAAADDCTAVAEVLLGKNFNEYNVDPSKIVIVGDSAGGNLAAVVSLRLRETKLEHKPKAQVLIYPAVHMFGFRSPSFTAYYAHYNGSALLSPSSMARWSLFYIGETGNHQQVHALLNNYHIKLKLLQQPIFAKTIPSSHLNVEEDGVHDKRADDYLSSIFLERATNPDVCPLLAESLASLPPAMVLTAGYDILRDEGMLYAKRLESEGVETVWKHYPTGYHGVLNMPMSRLRKEMMIDIANYVSNHI